MTKPIPWSGRIALLSLLPVALLLPLLFAGQRSFASAPASRFHQTQSTTHHAVYGRSGTLAALEAARNDPGAVFGWREMDQRELAPREVQRRRWLSFWEFHRPGPGRFPIRSASDLHTDWSINLGTAGTALAMYPAKFTLDTAATPSCANDFVVFPVNANGSATQPNIVAFNQLYSGNAGSPGICNRTPKANEDGINALNENATCANPQTGVNIGGCAVKLTQAGLQ